MLNNLTDDQEYAIYLTIIHAIKTNSGVGFVNGDQGHLAYLSGAKGEIGHGDSPDENNLFQVLSKLSHKFYGDVPFDLTTWEGFCLFATDSFNRHHHA